MWAVANREGLLRKDKAEIPGGKEVASKEQVFRLHQQQVRPTQ